MCTFIHPIKIQHLQGIVHGPHGIHLPVRETTKQVISDCDKCNEKAKENNMNECYGVNGKISRGLPYIMWSEKASQRSQYVKVKRNESYNGLGKEYSRRRKHQVLRRKWVCLHVPVIEGRPLWLRASVVPGEAAQVGGSQIRWAVCAIVRTLDFIPQMLVLLFKGCQFPKPADLV